MKIDIGGFDGNIISNINKSDVLVDGINYINKKNDPGANFMIIPINIYNILELSEDFEKCYTTWRGTTESSLLNVGRICGLDCYVDMYMPYNEVLLYWNKQIHRDNKLESILSGLPIKDEFIKIEIS